MKLRIRPSHAFDLLLLIYILLGAAYLRFTGLYWGEYHYLHPDERFLVWVTNDIQPVQNLADYFKTETSSLNPVNRGHPFYVYGTLPVFATRYLSNATHFSVGWEEILQVGRSLSAIFDLVTVFLVYCIGARLFGRRAGLLAAAFSALAVLQIQQAHFYTVDSFSTTFTTLAIYLAIRISSISSIDWEEHPLRAAAANLLTSLFFGLAVAMAMASKINTAPVALLLPTALFLQRRHLHAEEHPRHDGLFLICLFLGGLAAMIAFRICQPYAFEGPGFFNMLPASSWVQGLRDLQAQSSGDVDMPPALQWASRPIWFSGQNLAFWGIGIPFALLALAGFLWMAWRIWKGERNGVLLVWGWTAAYFTWQSMAWNPTMRYQLPIYPTLAVMAGWFLQHAWNQPWAVKSRLRRNLLLGLGILCLGLTAGWAFAFTRIYNRPITRVDASRWIFQNLPGPVTLEMQDANGPARRLLGASETAVISPDFSYSTYFDAPSSGTLTEITLPHINAVGTDGQPAPARIEVLISEARQSGTAGPSQEVKGPLDNLTLPLAQPLTVTAGKRYVLTFQTLKNSDKVELSGQVQLQLYHRTQSTALQDALAGIPAIRLPDGGTLRQVRLDQPSPADILPLSLTDTDSGENWTANAVHGSGSSGTTYQIDPPQILKPGSNYQVTLGGVTAGQSAVLMFLDDAQAAAVPPFGQIITEGRPYSASFILEKDSHLTSILFPRLAQQDPNVKNPGSLVFSMRDSLQPEQVIAEGALQINAQPSGDARGSEQRLTLNVPVNLTADHQYLVHMELQGAGSVVLRGSAPANESGWDDGLPMNDYGYNAYGGLYQSGLNFEMYWDDNAEKLQRFETTLDQADYLFISSNRQWGTTVRVPARYPLTTEYYRDLLGCPAGKDIVWCYRTAEAASFKGSLGFDLVKVFQSDPNFGPLRINTQFAEEAFTVYDHPKVLIFQKRADYNSSKVHAQLEAIDLNKVVHITPRKVSSWKDMLLPLDRWKQQQAGGTWSELFNPGALVNRSPLAAAVVWYLSITLLGWLIYPLLRLTLPGLKDRGYPLARTAGLLLLAYPVWLVGSIGLPVTRALIGAVFACLALLGMVLGFVQRKELARELKENWKYFLFIEAVILAFFLLDLAIRAGNPDLWHPAKGGEKPMDFSYFNAVLKSTTFPPYDPWLAGGSMNYYYYGFVLVGMPVKLLGITPAVAYNLVLPTLFSLLAGGVFSLGVSLSSASAERITRRAMAAGLIAAVAVALLGNQATVRMVWQGWERLGGGTQGISAPAVLKGFTEWVKGASLPYGPGDWYWIPSRAIQPEAGSEITEFPFFTFLYGDPHAHLISLAFTVLALAWAVSVFLSQARWKNRAIHGLGLAFGALAVGALRPSNTWDFPTYLVLAAVSLGVSAWRSAEADESDETSPARPTWWLRIPLEVRVMGELIVFTGLAFLLYQPFTSAFGQGYNSFDLWKGNHTGSSSYVVHWGLFLFVLTAWMMDETIDWMAATPLSALGRLKPYSNWIYAGLMLVVGAVLALVFSEVWIAWLVAPLGLWAVALILRPGQSKAKQVALFMAGTGLAITLFVELVALHGDLGRMNTVFKFYLQAWVLLGLSAAAGMGWLLQKIQHWHISVRAAWLTGLALLTAGALLCTLISARGKIQDRMASDAPTGLDGMAYMLKSTYIDEQTAKANITIQLAEDYNAIHWMQTNVIGSPVIVEANEPEYRWGSRFTIYTGLPGVVGWNFHQRQQRAITPEIWVTGRIAEIRQFYSTTDADLAMQFLKKYRVRYIIVGQNEQAYYPGPGLGKFTAQDGKLWKQVYSSEHTKIYEVINP